jgi:Dolichol kinase
MNEWLAFFYSFLFVMSVLGTASLLYRFQVVDAQTSRKLIHIGVAHWFFFVPLFDSLFVAMIAPVSFIGLNFMSQRFRIVQSMERLDAEDYGTVYYAVALSVITYVSVVVDLYAIGLVSMLILGWGDGLAALVGRYAQGPMIRANKTVYGSLAMLSASLIVLLVFLDSVGLSIIVAVVATATEVWTPKGFDNLSVPLLSMLLLWLL